MDLFNYDVVIDYTDPLTGETKQLDIRLRNSPALTQEQLLTQSQDIAAEILGEYKFADLGLTDPSVFVGQIESYVEYPEL